MITRRCPHCWRRAEPVDGTGAQRCPHCLGPLERPTAPAEVEDLVRARLYEEPHAALLSVAPRAGHGRDDG